MARAGALDQAWRLFEAAGLASEADDAAIACIQGRLLKDQAARNRSPDLYRSAARAYLRAADLQPATYPLINAATLSLLAGERAEAAILAAQVLDRIAAEPDEPETPYWRAATRAEALLLLDRHDQARAAFAEAIALAPLAWEDHASTLRQFGLILAAQGQDPAWLDAHRPPRSLHFGGHMSFDARVSRREHLDDRIRAVLEEERVGFGFGALAAGADILIAEALLERGAELHAVLPGGPDAFAAVSVEPFGKAWRRRFDSLLAGAASVRGVRPLGVPPGRLVIEVADEIAMGAAVMNARRLETQALQLLVLPDEPSSAAGAPVHGRWAEAGGRQRLVTAPREAVRTGEPPRPPAFPHDRLALLAVAAPDGEGAGARLAALFARMADAPPPAVPPYFTGREVMLAYRDVAQAGAAAVALAAPPGEGDALAIGGHYGIAETLEDPFAGRMRLAGEAAALAAGAAASAPPGSVCVTADFAAAFAGSGAAGLQSELVGELAGAAGAIDLYALKPRLGTVTSDCPK
jgi:tetratricopeptide (TPR) repeat protein